MSTVAADLVNCGVRLACGVNDGDWNQGLLLHANSHGVAVDGDDKIDVPGWIGQSLLPVDHAT
jgi:hypothetical protein